MEVARPQQVWLPVPSFWRGTLADVADELAKVRKGAVQQIGTSAGGRPIHVVTYGPEQPVQRTANYSSAMGAGSPRAYACKRDRLPSLLLVGATHGAEMEGMVALNNLLHVLETGVDYRGRQWNGLREAAEGVRLSVIPCLNPDGRARVEPESLVGETLDVCRYWTQGTRKSGELYTWPEVKAWHPMQDDVGFLGGYFNDDGINPMHDTFFMDPCPEVQTIFRFVDTEVPDVVILLHTGGGTFLFTQTYFVPDFCRERIYDLARYIEDGMTQEGIRFNSEACNPQRSQDARTASLNLTSALHHVSGAVPITLESPAGLVNDQGVPVADWDTILTGHLVIFERALRYVTAHREDLHQRFW